MAVLVDGGFKIVLDKLDDLDKRMSDFYPMLDKMSKVYYDFVDDVFETEGAAGSGTWVPLKPYTVAKRQGKEHPILHWFGQLRDAATSYDPYGAEGVSADQIYTNSSVELRLWGDKVRHNTKGGFVNETGNYVPQREFWPDVDGKVADIMMNPVESWADDWLKA